MNDDPKKRDDEKARAEALFRYRVLVPLLDKRRALSAQACSERSPTARAPLRTNSGPWTRARCGRGCVGFGKEVWKHCTRDTAKTRASCAPCLRT